MAVFDDDDAVMNASPLGLIALDVAGTRDLLIDLRARSPQVTYDQRTICALTNSASISGMNTAAKAMLALRGQPLPDRIARLLPDNLRRQFAEGLTGLVDGTADMHLEGRLQSADGSDFAAVLSGWKGTNTGTTPRVWISITHTQTFDTVNAREALLGELAHSARVAMLGEMTASIAHEVNQPLSSIVTSAEAGLRWLDRDAPDLEEVKTLLRRIVSSGNRAGQIVSALRGMATNAKPSRTAVSVAALIEETTLIIGAELARQQVGLRVEVTADLPDVLADRTQILQVIVNLATNAAQAMADGQAWNRTLAIRAHLVEECRVVIEVEDSGPGVDPAVREKLFQSFYTTKGSGMGMGLAICRSIIEAHNSEIQLKSSPYLGARFSFFLETTALGSSS